MRAARVFGFWCASGARFVHEAARVVRERRRAMRWRGARVIEFRSTKSAAVQFLALCFALTRVESSSKWPRPSKYIGALRPRLSFAGRCNMHDLQSAQRA